MHEAQLYPRNCFVTLTYDEQHLPAGDSLDHRDFQLFMKRLRKRFPQTIRYYMCGEYGEQLQRPHFHACLFNVDFPDQKTYSKNDQGNYVYSSPTLTSLWPFGQCTVAKLNLQTAGYTARYVLTRVNGDRQEAHYGGKTPEYNRMSTHPGIGSAWWSKYAGTDVLPGDYVVDSKGRKCPVPPYYDKLLKRSGGDLAQVKAERELRAFPHRHDNTTVRLSVKEAVKRAQLRQLERKL